MSVIEFVYTKYHDMMVPIVPIKMKGRGGWFGPLWTQEQLIPYFPRKRQKPWE